MSTYPIGSLVVGGCSAADADDVDEAISDIDARLTALETRAAEVPTPPAAPDVDERDEPPLPHHSGVVVHVVCHDGNAHAQLIDLCAYWHSRKRNSMFVDGEQSVLSYRTPAPPAAPEGDLPKCPMTGLKVTVWKYGAGWLCGVQGTLGVNSPLVYGDTREQAEEKWRALCAGWGDPMGKMIAWLVARGSACDTSVEEYAAECRAYSACVRAARALREGREP